MDARRAQIVEAVLPVVIEFGERVTSKQLAAAAGVAEGTIYKAFGDKEQLLLAVIRAESERPDALGEWLDSGAAHDFELDSLVIEIARRALAEAAQSFALFQALGQLMKTPSQDEIERFDAMLEPWIRALDRHRDELSVPAPIAASMLRMLVFAAGSGVSWGENGWGIAVDPFDVARVFLYGVRGAVQNQPTTALQEG